MNSRTTRRFRELFASLPTAIQRQMPTDSFKTIRGIRVCTSNKYAQLHRSIQRESALAIERLESWTKTRSFGFGLDHTPNTTNC